MKRQWRVMVWVLAILLGLTPAASAVTAAPAAGSLDGWSSITIWAYLDNNEDGALNAGDTYLHEVGACLTSKKAHWTYCGATDYGDVWWEPMQGGQFIAWLDAGDPEIPAGYRLSAITCLNTGVEAPGQGCKIRLDRQEARFMQVPGGLMNVYYGFSQGK